MKNKKKVEAAPLRHLAVIMDGNGRWAKKHGMPRSAGHRYGAEKLYDLCEMCVERKIKYVTVFAFSTENWQRPEKEVSQLMDLFVEFYHKYKDKMENADIRLRFSGIKDKLPKNVISIMEEAETTSQNRQTMQLIMAFNYGGRREIVDASKKLVQAVADGKLNIEDITEDCFRSFLYCPDVPDPDLIIRPSGEERLSNFLLWQAAYAEFYSAQVLWPDFNARTLDKALAEYKKRDRRFGKVK